MSGAPDDVSTRVIRLGLIGISGYGRSHLRLAREFEERGEARLVAVTIINPAEEALKMAELLRAEVRVYEDFKEMLRAEAGQLDACLVPTGIPWHARMTMAALRAGLHVLVEKPLAGSVAEGVAIRAVERAVGRVVAVGFQDIYTAAARRLQAELAGGLIGEVRAIRLIGVWPRAEEYYARNGWAGRLAVGGAPVRDSPLMNGFSHFVHLALFFAGRRVGEGARAREVEAELWRAHAIESFDTAVVRARTVEGVMLWLGVSHAAAEPREVRLRVEGTRGAVEWRHESRVLVVRREGEKVERRVLPDMDETRREMMRCFLARVRDGEGFVADTTMAINHLELIEAVHAVGEIREVPKARVRRVAGAKGVVVAIEGINGALEAAEARAGWLSEVVEGENAGGI